MEFVSVRVITADIKRLVGFYERAAGVRATWFTEDFAEVGRPWRPRSNRGWQQRLQNGPLLVAQIAEIGRARLGVHGTGS